jgi:hypothetical protein
LKELLREEILLKLLTADISEHRAINFNAWAELLTALSNHLFTLGWIIDDISILVGEIVFC